MKCPCKVERRVQFGQPGEVMKLLFVPEKCHHSAIESYFEWVSDPDKPECGDFCSKCNNKVPDFTKRVNKEALQSLLCEKVDGSKITVGGFVKLLKRNKAAIFHKDDVPKNNKTGQIHGLCLQLVATGMITFEVTDRSKIGTKKFTKADLSLVCPKMKETINGNEHWNQGYRIDRLWSGMNLNCNQNS